MINVKQIRSSKALLLAIVLLVAALPISAGLFQWSRLGRLIPQTGFEPSVSVIAGHPTHGMVLYAGTLRSTDNTNLIFKSTNASSKAFEPRFCFTLIMTSPCVIVVKRTRYGLCLE